MEKIIEWQSRPLDEVYPIIYLDCIVVETRQDKRVINKAVYVALGVNMAGHKELLGLWLSENEGAKFWLSVLTELKNRGIKDVFVAKSGYQLNTGQKAVVLWEEMGKRNKGTAGVGKVARGL